MAVFHDTENGNFLLFLILALLTGLPGGVEGAGGSFCPGLASHMLLEHKEFAPILLGRDPNLVMEGAAFFRGPESVLCPVAFLRSHQLKVN